MQRYFVDYPALELGQTITLLSEDNHHAVRVMRGQVDDQIFIVSQNQAGYLAQLDYFEADTAYWKVIRPLEGHPELPVKVTLACGLSKNDKMDWIVQKTTEGGMNQFIPLQLSRDVVKWTASKAKKRSDRLQKIAKEAAEQSHRLQVPKIEQILKLDELADQASNYDYKLIAYEETAKEGEHGQLRSMLRSIKPDQSVLVVFGSEGGITQEEVTRLEAVGFKRCSLGPRILRAETAPIYLMSAISYALEVH